jgi:glycosyltransferase involved in cell wall biosynthesis
MPRIPIAFLITDLQLGGSPRLLRDLALGLHRSTEFDPAVISLKPLPVTGETIPQTLRDHGITVHTLNMATLRQLPRAIPRLTELLNAIQPAILYSILIHANALATLTIPFLNRRPKLIQSIHTLQPRPRWHWVLQGMLAPCADAIVSPSQPILDKIAAYGPFHRGVVIPNGVDIDRFANAEPIPPAGLPWPPDAPVVGYIGRFDPVKNLPLLLRGFAKLATDHALAGAGGGAARGGRSDALRGRSEATATPQRRGFEGLLRPPHLALVGYGPQEAALRALAKSLHIAPQVHFLPPTTTPERWYKCFTCHCLPSSVEGFGLTVVESLAAGVPVVAVNSPVYTAMGVQAFGGVLFTGGSEALAQALHGVIAQQHHRPHLPHLPPSARPSAPSTPPKAPHTPPQAPQAALDHLRKRYSIERMVELHTEFFKNI